ncbi:MAG: biotin--[acetyl-CoA-carboxylase] ligase [Nitrospinae bacterium]|nr:biotin--[acetyl-CoA-carboxylase] ligase [Nitrospinota bacterium]MZH41038.1 biotin--[acetyl-CoA-carboxylase] ligase [Nitrospinota bacterium]
MGSSFDIDISALQKRLNTIRIGHPLKVLPQTDSTSEEIRRDLTLPEGTVVISDLQTHGRGRQGRTWHSESGTGLYLSILLKPHLPPENLHFITLMAGVATVSAIQQNGAKQARLKWPNDILLNGKKLSGILCEHIPGKAVIVGIGINMNQTQFPSDIQDIATSMKMETGNSINRADLILSLLKNLDCGYEEYLNGNKQSLLQKWTSNTDMFGKTVTVHQKGVSITGIAMSLDSDGRLILQTSDGETHILGSGELLT